MSDAAMIRVRVPFPCFATPSALLLGTLLLALGCGNGCRRASPELGATPAYTVVNDGASDGSGDNAPEDDSDSSGDGARASAAEAAAAPLESVQAITADEYLTCALLTDGRPVCWGTFEEIRPRSEDEEALPLAYNPAPRPILLPGNVRLREISLWGQARGLTEDGRLMIWGRFLTPFWVSERRERSPRRVIVPIAPDLEPYEEIAKRYPDQLRPSSRREEAYWHRGLLDSVRPLWSGIRDVERLIDGGCHEDRAGAIHCITLSGHDDGWELHGPHSFPTAEYVFVAGPYFACIRDREGAVDCWAQDAMEARTENPDAKPQFRNDSRMRIPLPQPAVDLSFANSICAALRDGSVACWQAEPLIQSTPDTTADLPLDVREGVDAVSVHGDVLGHECAITKEARVRCWAPHLPPPDSPMPPVWYEVRRVREVPGVENVVALTTGSTHACALTKDGRVWCWGFNDAGQLGRGTVDEDSRQHPPGLVASAIDPFGSGDLEQ
jgi:hypothetical protein